MSTFSKANSGSDFREGHTRDIVVVGVDRNWPEEFGRNLLAGERAFGRGLGRPESVN